MTEKLTYDKLPDEDKLLMDDLFRYKAKKIRERKEFRVKLAILRKEEMDCTKEIMNLSQRKIGEKFDLGANSAKPLTKRNRENIKDRLSKKEVKVQTVKLNPIKIQKKIMNVVNKRKHNKGVAPDFWVNC